MKRKKKKNDDVIKITAEEWQLVERFKKDFMKTKNDEWKNIKIKSESILSFKDYLTSMSKEQWNDLTKFKKAEIYKKYLEFVRSHRTQLPERFTKYIKKPAN